jgi:hypothetical protein
MKIKQFIENYKEAFSEAAELPLLFWYSDMAINTIEKINGCFFKCMNEVRAGISVSLNADVIGCGGGKFYTGFTDMPEYVPAFVSTKEKYKQTPEMVVDFATQLNRPAATKKYLNFARIDKVESFDGIEGILFLATPDILSGLVTWALFDNNDDDAVSTLFGSGCCTAVTYAVLDNLENRRRTFIGFFDPSVRPHFEANILSFMIPMSRFREMYYTMTESCLFDTHAWGKIRERISLITHNS